MTRKIPYADTWTTVNPELGSKTYAAAEWDRITAADPLTVADEPWTRHRVSPCLDPKCELCHDEPGRTWLGAVLLALAFALGIAVGWVIS